MVIDGIRNALLDCAALNHAAPTRITMGKDHYDVLHAEAAHPLLPTDKNKPTSVWGLAVYVDTQNRKRKPELS